MYSMIYRKLANIGSCGNPASQNMICEFVKLFGGSIPLSYKNYLYTFGWIDCESLELYGLGAGIPSYLDIRKILLFEREDSGNKLPESLLPIYNDGFGNLICIKCDGPDSDKMVKWEHESGDQLIFCTSFQLWIESEFG